MDTLQHEDDFSIKSPSTANQQLRRRSTLKSPMRKAPTVEHEISLPTEDPESGLNTRAPYKDYCPLYRAILNQDLGIVSLIYDLDPKLFFLRDDGLNTLGFAMLNQKSRSINL
jgi:hypothetical protein